MRRPYSPGPPTRVPPLGSTRTEHLNESEGDQSKDSIWGKYPDYWGTGNDPLIIRRGRGPSVYPNCLTLSQTIRIPSV